MGQSNKELHGEFGSGKQDNIKFTLNAGESMTCYFKVDGDDSGTEKYYNLRYTAKKVQIIVNNVASLTHINGSEKKYPITLGTAAANVWRRGIEWLTIKVRADSDNTTFEIQAS